MADATIEVHGRIVDPLILAPALVDLQGHVTGIGVPGRQPTGELCG